MTLRQRFYVRYIKRPIGFCGALAAVVVTAPLMLGTMLLLLFANKNGFGGIFFTQSRPGKGEKVFKVLKFKSMTDERDEHGCLLPDSERLTRVGRFIRKTSIDELPQLFNILKGDMAFIGPRPLLCRYLPYYTEREHHRHDVCPGMTGWAQTHGRNCLGWNYRLAMDVFYVENVSLALDVRIFFSTIVKVFSGEGDVPDKPENFFDVERSSLG